MRHIFAGDYAIVGYRKASLVLNGEPGFAYFVRQGILINFFKKMGTVNPPPMTSRERSFRLLSFACICEIAFLICVGLFLCEECHTEVTEELTRGGQFAG